VDLQADEARVWIFGNLAATELFTGCTWICTELGARLPVEQDYVCSASHSDLKRMPRTRCQPLIVGVVLLASRSSRILDFVDRARSIVGEPVGLVPSGIAARLFVDLDLVAGIHVHVHGGQVAWNIRPGCTRELGLAQIAESHKHAGVVISNSPRVWQAEIEQQYEFIKLFFGVGRFPCCPAVRSDTAQRY